MFDGAGRRFNMNGGQNISNDADIELYNPIRSSFDGL